MGGVLKEVLPEPKDESKKYEKQAAAAAEEEKRKALARQSRGMDSNIKTSYSGILSAKEDGLQRKKLLGE